MTCVGGSGHRALAYARPVLALPVVRLDPELPLPTYARDGDAGLDLLARQDVTLEAGGGRALVPTGVAVALPSGHAGLVMPRSGLALRHGVTVLNAPGLIDAGYRDELQVLLINTDPREDYEIHRGDRIAQLVVAPVEACQLVAVTGLEGTGRGGGLGHTGR